MLTSRIRLLIKESLKSLVFLMLFVSGFVAWAAEDSQRKTFRTKSLSEERTKTLDIKPTGFKRAKTLELKGRAKTLTTKSSSQPIHPHTGSRRGIFLITNWESFCQEGLTNSDQFATTDQVRAATDDLRAWYQEVSADHFDLTWDIYGPSDVAYPQQCSAINKIEITSHAVLGVLTANPELNICDYDYISVYPTPGTRSPSGNLVATGFRNNFQIAGCRKDFSVTLLTWKANREDKIDSPEVYRHEFGHSLRLDHANSWDCGSNTASYSATGCVSAEYGFILDTMGMSSGHFNCAYKQYLGWATATQIDASGGSYPITALEANSDSPKCLKMNVGGTFGELYIDYRLRGGYDSYPSNFNYFLPSPGGLVLYRVGYLRGVNYLDSPTAWLLDCIPESNPTGPSGSVSDWLDAAIGPGQVCDTGLGFTVSFTTTTTTSVSVTITSLSP